MESSFEFECSSDRDGHCETHDSTWSDYGAQETCDAVAARERLDGGVAVISASGVDPMSEDTPASVFLVVQTDEDDGTDAGWWILAQEPTILDARKSAEEMVEVIEKAGYSPVQLEDSVRVP